MQQAIFEIVSNRQLTPLVYEMQLVGDTSAIKRAGEFVEVSIDGLFLRRPISVCNFDEGRLTLVYKVVGKGTAAMAAMQKGVKADLLTGLGNGFNAEAAGHAPLLVGGGVGVPPLYRLTRELLERGLRPTVILGFNTADEIFYEEEFKALGVEVIIATADGSKGIKGFVTDAIRESGTKFDYLYSCGPLPMLKALAQTCSCDGELSLEERMGCGFGICMGCSINTRTGAKRVCKEGPVFKKEDIIW